MCQYRTKNQRIHLYANIIIINEYKVPTRLNLTRSKRIPPEPDVGFLCPLEIYFRSTRIDQVEYYVVQEQTPKAITILEAGLEIKR